MTKFLVIVFMVALSLSVVACDGEDGTNGVAGIVGPTGPPGPASFVDETGETVVDLQAYWAPLVCTQNPELNWELINFETEDINHVVSGSCIWPSDSPQDLSSICLEGRELVLEEEDEAHGVVGKCKAP